MKLTRPTDFEILENLNDGKRDIAANLACRLEKDRAYLNTRLPVLCDYELLDRVGPAENSGLYQITQRGRLVVEYRDQYDNPETDFETLIETKLTEQT
jgi:hypothetical protein